MAEPSATPKEREIVELLKQCANLFPAVPKKSAPSVLERAWPGQKLIKCAVRSAATWVTKLVRAVSGCLRLPAIPNHRAAVIATVTMLAVLTIAGGYRWFGAGPTTTTPRSDSLPRQEAKLSPLPEPAHPQSSASQNGQSELTWPADNGGGVIITLDAAYIYVTMNEIVYKIAKAPLAIAKIEVFALPERVEARSGTKDNGKRDK